MPAVTHARCRRDGAFSIEVGGVLGADRVTGPRLLTARSDGSWTCEPRAATPAPDRAADLPTVRWPELVAAPALYDAHVHLHPDLPLVEYLAYGVGQVRDLGSRAQDAPAAPALDDCADPVPALVRGGPMLDRPGPPRLLIAAAWESPEQLPGLLEDAVAGGASWLKLYEGFPVELFAPTVGRAHRLGLRVAVHPGPGDYRAALDAGVDELEHLACLVPPGPRGTRALLRRWADRRPGDPWPALPEGTAVCPTLLVQRTLVAEAGRGWTFEGHDPAMADFWRSSAIARAPWSADELTDGERAVDALAAALGELDSGGVRWVVGSDTPNPGLRPGLSLWQEMNLLVAAGLDRDRVYRAAAVAPAVADAGGHPLVFLPAAVFAAGAAAPAGAFPTDPFPTEPAPILLRGCLYRPEESTRAHRLPT